MCQTHPAGDNGAAEAVRIGTARIISRMTLPPVSEIADEALMLGFAAGKAIAFEALYDRHCKSIWRYFYRNGVDAAQAEDLAQDVWLAVINHAAHYEVRSKFTTWLFTMAHHKLVDYWRRQRIQISLSIDTEEGLALAHVLFAESGFEPEQQLNRRRLAERLLAALAELPVLQRSSFLLQAEAGMTVAEIAIATEVNVETAKSRLRYAREKLRLALEEVAL